MKYIVALLSAVLICLYISSAPPTIIFGDSGEISAAVASLGIAHPPGYPVYMLAGKLATLAFPGDLSWRIGLLSALLGAMFFAAAAFAGVFFLKQYAPENNRKYLFFSAVTAAFLFSSSGLFWFLSSYDKGGIYIMAVFCALIAMTFSGLYVIKSEKKYLFLSYYAAGFLAVLHPTMLLFAVFILAIPFISGKKPGMSLVTAFFLFLFSLITPYAYLFIRAGANPVMDWAGISSAGEVINHIFRKPYMQQQQHQAPFMAAFGFKLLNYAVDCLKTYWPALLFVIPGLYFMYKKSVKLFYTFIILYAADLAAVIIFTGGSVSPLYAEVNSVFFLPVNLLLIMPAAAGIYLTVASLPERPVFKAAVIPLVFIALSGFQILNSAARNSNSGYYMAYDRAENMLRTAPVGSVIFTGSDSMAFNILYLRQVKGKYNDRRVYDSNANLFNLDIFKNDRKAGTLTVKREKEIEALMISADPDNVFYTDFTVLENTGMATTPYGILNCTGKQKGTSGLMSLCSIRGFFQRGNRDIFTEEYFGSVLSRMMEYEAQNGDVIRADMYKSAAIKEGGKAALTYTTLAMIYYENLHEAEKSLNMLEKVILLEPFNTVTMDLIVKICNKEGYKDRANYWVSRIDKAQ